MYWNVETSYVLFFIFFDFESQLLDYIYTLDDLCQRFKCGEFNLSFPLYFKVLRVKKKRQKKDVRDVSTQKLCGPLTLFSNLILALKLLTG